MRIIIDHLWFNIVVRMGIVLQAFEIYCEDWFFLFMVV